MTEWRDMTLGDICELKRGYDLPAASREIGVVPIVSSGGITGYHSEPKVRGPGVVTGRYGTLGEVYFVEEDFWPLNTALYVRDFKGNEPRFVAALLESLELGRNDGAAAVPGVNRNQLHGIRVRCPDRRIQRLIGIVLGTLDALIANNRRRIALLEQMARVIYREWFVHFRYPGHESGALVDSPLDPIPEGWSVRNLFDVADVSFGFSFKSNWFADAGPFPVIRIRDVPVGATRTFSSEQPAERYRVTDGDVLIGMDGDFHLRQWIGGVAWLNQRVARLRPRGGLTARHLMLAVEAPIKELNAAIVGTTVAHLGKRHLEKVKILVPSPDVLAVASPILDDIANHECALAQSCRQLGMIRDLLLPKLVTGQIDVSKLDLDELVGTAT
ncbi:MAG: restriction endonuclease subunit S [Catenulispora sp.]